MGEANDKPRKEKHQLPKVPKYEEPNTLPMPGFGSSGSFGKRFGRFGHSADGKEHHRPALPGRMFLRLLGLKPKDPSEVEPRTREHEPDITSAQGGGTVPRLQN